MEILKKGDKGPAVAKLQEQLLALGFPMNVDGEFGQNTYFAVITLQTIFGVEVHVDGVVGDETQALMLAQVARGWNLVTARNALGAPHEESDYDWEQVSDEALAGIAANLPTTP